MLPWPPAKAEAVDPTNHHLSLEQKKHSKGIEKVKKPECRDDN